MAKMSKELREAMRKKSREEALRELGEFRKKKREMERLKEDYPDEMIRKVVEKRREGQG